MGPTVQLPSDSPLGQQHSTVPSENGTNGTAPMYIPDGNMSVPSENATAPVDMPDNNVTVPKARHLGCFTTHTHRFLTVAAYLQEENNSPAKCVKACLGLGYSYSGLEYGTQCWCGAGLQGSVMTSQTKCRITCTGDSNVTCGGSWRADVYSTAAAVPSVEPSLVGCFETEASSRMLTYQYSTFENTIEECTAVCRHNGYKFAGLQAGDECWCRVVLPF
eukprot:TRINITY_DN53_c0_g1_i12.p1 TRINITY_DN53_c0_g1~~TRINITY_DN53_c0_g1_i12.p1  ORF type:complete len:219 (+),score=52.73 TRINITY_DN53_c0_g1_i12:377-1033(+)